MVNFREIADKHPLDIVIKVKAQIDLNVEELPRSSQLSSDCISTASTLSTASTAGGSIACISCVGSISSVTSSGGDEPPAPDEEPPCPDDDGCEPPEPSGFY